MSIAGVASTGSSYQTANTNPYVQIKQDVQNLGKALQPGNLSNAQQAFATLQQDSSATGQSQESQTSNSPNQAIQNVGNALQSGDLSGAQQAFASMQKIGKGQGHHHHQHSSQSSDSSGTDVSLATKIQEMTYSGLGTIGTASKINSGDSSSASSAVNLLS